MMKSSDGFLRIRSLRIVPHTSVAAVCLTIDEPRNRSAAWCDVAPFDKRATGILL